MDMSSMGMMSVSVAPPPPPTGDDNVDDQTFSSNNDGEESESQENGNSDVAGGFAYGILGATGVAGAAAVGFSMRAKRSRRSMERRFNNVMEDVPCSEHGSTIDPNSVPSAFDSKLDETIV